MAAPCGVQPPVARQQRDWPYGAADRPVGTATIGWPDETADWPDEAADIGPDGAALKAAAFAARAVSS